MKSKKKITKAQKSTKSQNRGKIMGALWKWFWLGMLLIITAPLLLLQIWHGVNLSEFEVKKQNALRNPEKLVTQLALTEFVLMNGDFETGDLLLAQWPENRTSSELAYENTAEVLGSQTTEIERLREMREWLSGERIKELIEKWETVKRNYEGYRDAYLQLAEFYWRLRDHVTAKEYIKVASELDPNSEKVAKVRELVENRGAVK